MSQNLCRQIAMFVALVVFVGCQTRTNSPAYAQSVTADLQSNDAGASPRTTLLASQATVTKNASRTRGLFSRVKSKPAGIPRVLLSQGDVAACKVKVGDLMPEIELPQLGGSKKVKLASLFGKKASVVLFWRSDRRMSQQQLADVGDDIVTIFGKGGVAVVGIAVEKSAQEAEATLKQAHATFPNLLDADGKAFAQIGTGRFPRTYVLDPHGKIVWFDIEYSAATRRELHQVLRAVAGEK